jgi:hypothetical protein
MINPRQEAFFFLNQQLESSQSDTGRIFRKVPEAATGRISTPGA